MEVVLVVFCRHDSKLVARDLFAAITRQLVDSDSDSIVLSKVQAFYFKHDIQCTKPTTSEFIELLQDVFTQYGHVTISIDALDESPDIVKEELLDGLSKLGVTVWITSRPSASMFMDMLDGVHTLRLEDSPANHDIARFIRIKLTTIPRLRGLFRGKDLVLHLACDKLNEKSSGMYVQSDKIFTNGISSSNSLGSC